MRITRFHVGDIYSLSATKSAGLAYTYGNKQWHLSDPKREVEKGDSAFASTTQQRGPFERADFGNRDRLAWPCGACAMPQEIPYVAWGERYAMWFTDQWLFAVDATKPVVVALHLPMEVFALKAVVFHAGTAYIQSARDVMAIPVAAIEGLFDRSSGQIDVHVRELYPHRRPAAQQKMFVEYIFSNDVSLVDRDGDGGWLRIPFVPGLEQGIQVTLHDELARNHFREIEVPGYPRETLEEVRPAELTTPCALHVEPAVDPAGPLRKASPAARTEELGRVFALLADDPKDDAARLVVVDLLEEAGEPYAAHFAKLLAGDATDATRNEALGPLANYLTDIEWRGGLPRYGTLSASAPNDEEIGDVIAADHRLGFFHTLRLGDGSFRVYNKLVASPRAMALRHVDGSRSAILQALIKGGRRNLRRLSNVKFANREVLEALADPTFDSVLRIETDTQTYVVDRLLDFIARDELGFFARTPRHVIIHERDGDYAGLVPHVLAAWQRLPLAKMTIGGVTIARDGTATAVEGALDDVRALVAARFRFVAVAHDAM